MWLFSKKNKETKEPANNCNHKWGHWFHFTNHKESEFSLIENELKAYNRAKIVIQRICSDCGELESKSYKTALFDNEKDLTEAHERILKYLEQTILKQPESPAPKPEPIKCEHEFTKYSIVSRWVGPTHGEIVIERYCNKCCGFEKKHYETEKYSEDFDNQNVIYQDMLALEESLKNTILKEST